MQTNEETTHRRHMQIWKHNRIDGRGKQLANHKENWRIQETTEDKNQSMHPAFYY